MTNPIFPDNPDLSISSIGEKELIRRIRIWLGTVAPKSPHGMGDDCAVLNTSPNLITTDSVVLGRHFLEHTPPDLVGKKLFNRNASDIAAMGGMPQNAVLAGVIPRSTGLSWLEAFVKGLAQAAEACDTSIVGGDLSECSSDLVFNLTLLGHAQTPLLRNGASIEDRLFTTGKLGGSILGKHLNFQPRLKEGKFLAACPDVTACIDVTDGLAIDLEAILPANSSALIHSSKVPISEDAHKLSQNSGHTALWHALNDGEDHELLFTMRKDTDFNRFIHQWESQLGSPVTEFGRIVNSTQNKALICSEDGLHLPGEGYDHFR